MSTSVLLVNLTVLLTVMEADLGRRKISSFRILRPFLVAAAIVPLFIKSPAGSGNGLVLEIALAAAGVLLGLVAAGGLIRIRVEPSTRKPTSVAGFGYAAFWFAVIGARLLFTYGSNHWYQSQIGQWLLTNHISVNALTDALIFMALAMTLARTSRLAVGRMQARRQLNPLEVA